MKVVEKVSILPVITSLDIHAERVLRGALKRKIQSCVVIGYDEDGELYFASSFADGGDVLWVMEKAKLALMDV